MLQKSKSLNHLFVATGLSALTCCLIMTSAAWAWKPTEKPPLRLKPNQLYLVADPRLQGKSEGVKMTLHEFERHSGNPIIRPEHPWEGKTADRPGFIQLGGTAMYDREQKLFKMWYSAWTAGFGRNFVCYATSQDGIRWVKPKLGIHAYEGNKETNIVTVGNAAAVVCKDPAANDPARRWIMWGKQCRPGEAGKPADYGVYRFFSPDGVRWTREQQKPNLPYHYPQKVLGGIMGDAGATFWFPQLGKHVAIHQTVRRPNPRPAPNDRQKNSLRIFVRFDSADGLKWNEPTVAFDSDERDFKIDPYHQFYNISIHPFGELFIGLMWEYHPGQKTIDIGYGVGTDTVTWERPFRGKPLLPLGPKGAFDCRQVKASAHLAEKDATWWLYYSGDDSAHGHKHSARTCRIGLARMPIGRIVSADAGAEGGLFETPMIRVPDGVFRVNCDAVGGEVRVEVLSADGQVIDGRSAAECVPISGDHAAATASWSAGPVASLFTADTTVRLRFHLTGAKLYGFQFE